MGPAGNDSGGIETPADRSRLVFSLIASTCVVRIFSRAQEAVDIELTRTPQTVNQ
jgi:hypothetical protein